MDNTRKPVSKKMRFDVFKRDLFTCVYCGSKPPKVVLEIDHIQPVSKGGKNRQDNLVTSCFACNRGKGAVELSSIPESLDERASRIKEAEAQLKAYRKILDEMNKRVSSDCWDVVHELIDQDCDSIRSDWFKSIKRFIGILGRERCCESADIAYSKHPNDTHQRWKYFCGICWTMIRETE